MPTKVFNHVPDCVEKLKNLGSFCEVGLSLGTFKPIYLVRGRRGEKEITSPYLGSTSIYFAYIGGGKEEGRGGATSPVMDPPLSKLMLFELIFLPYL